MTELAPTAATALVGAAAAAVVAWGAWISLGSSRLGPDWALAALERWRPFPWALALLGAAAMVLISPAWAGVGIVYVAVVTGWLSRTVRRRMLSVREAFGGFDPDVSPHVDTRRTGMGLVTAAVALGGLATWDITVRGWVGGFGLAIALLSGVAGITLLRRA